MFDNRSARVDARLLFRALSLTGLLATAFGAATAARSEAIAAFQVDPIAALNPSAHRLTEADLRAAVQQADFSAATLASRPASALPILADKAPPRLVAPSFLSTFTAHDVARPIRAMAAANGRELECLSQAVYFEARGEPMAGQAAVAQVVMNRVRHPAFPKSVCGVVFQRAGHSCQFSWACRGPGAPGSNPQWAQARAVATRVLAGEVIASIGFATHFNGVHGGGFGGGLQRVALIGGHAFYRFNGAKGASTMFQSAPVRMDRAIAAPAKPTFRPVYASFAVLPSTEAASQLLAKATGAVQQAGLAAQSAASELVERWKPELNLKPVPDAAPSASLDRSSSSDRTRDSRSPPVG